MSNGSFVWAIDENGKPTKCYAEPENRGKRNCKHKYHQTDGQDLNEFMEHLDKLKTKYDYSHVNTIDEFREEKQKIDKVLLDYQDIKRDLEYSLKGEFGLYFTYPYSDIENEANNAIEKIEELKDKAVSLSLREEFIDGMLDGDYDEEGIFRVDPIDTYYFDSEINKFKKLTDKVREINSLSEIDGFKAKHPRIDFDKVSTPEGYKAEMESIMEELEMVDERTKAHNRDCGYCKEYIEDVAMNDARGLEERAIAINLYLYYAKLNFETIQINELTNKYRDQLNGYREYEFN